MSDILYAAPVSLYSGKARSYMDWKGVDYQEQLSDMSVYRDIIVPHVGRPVIPVVKTAQGQFIQDTTLIIDHYETLLGGPSVYPEGPTQHLAALLIETFGDEWLVIPAMHYRWNYNEEWIYSEFGRTSSPDTTPEEQYALGKERAGPFRGSVPMLGITEETIPAIEKGYKALLTDLDAHFSVHDYLFGSRPSIGDFGLIGPLYAHLYRDPESGKIMEKVAPRVAQWVRRMVDVQNPLSGEFLPDDIVPDTLLPVLRRMMDEQMPHLQGTANLLAQWVRDSSETEIPRAIGMLPYSVQGVDAMGVALPFRLWMLQHPLDFYCGLTGADKSAADMLLDQVGGDAFRHFELPQRVAYADYRLQLA